jgi:hypothetical protein
MQDFLWRNVVDAELRVLPLTTGRSELIRNVPREETLDQWTAGCSRMKGCVVLSGNDGQN